MSKKYIILTIFIIFTLAVFLPPIIHGYIYPNNSDDSAFHMRYIASLQIGGEGGTVQYWGQNILGYVVVSVSNLTGVSTNLVFMWFNFLILWLIGVLSFLLLNSVLNWKAGLIGMFLVTFGTSSTLNLFDTGAIYDLTVVGVLVPLFLYCVVKYVSKRKWWWVVLAVFIMAFSFVFHSMVIKYIFGASSVEAPPNLLSFWSMAGSVIMVLGLLAIGIIIYKRKTIKLNLTHYVLLGGFGLLILLLSVFAFTKLTSYPYRFAIDLAIVTTLFVAYLWGLIVVNFKMKYLNAIIAVALILVCFSNLNTYFHHNSAIKEADKEAIEYLNSIDGKYFSCSPEIAPWVYERFTDKRYKVGELPYITRNEPMTYKTTEGSPYFWSMPAYKITPDTKTNNTKVFTDSEIVIIVYGEENND